MNTIYLLNNIIFLTGTIILKDMIRNVAFLNYNQGKSYVVYFPYGGEVGLNLTSVSGNFELKWLSADNPLWSHPVIHEGGRVISPVCPYPAHGLL